MKRLLHVSCIVLVMLLAGCAQQTPQAGAPSGTLTPKPVIVMTPISTEGSHPAGSLTPTVGHTGAETHPASTGMTPASPLPSGETVRLRLWLPPQFDPYSGTSNGDVLRARLDDFERQHPNVTVEVRVKALTGQAGLLDSLSAAKAAAPLTLPDVIALPRGDLEAAAIKGLVTPLDDLTAAMGDADWYDYARQLASIQGSVFGLPFAGDALVLLYRPAEIGHSNPDWSAISHKEGLLAFPAADPQALFATSLYLGCGGEIEDNQHRPTITADAFEQTLKFFQSGARNGMIPMTVTTYDTDAQVWQAYREQRAQLAITWASRYLTELPLDTIAKPVPPVCDKPLTLTSGWVWAVSTSQAERQPLSVELAEFLIDSRFLSEWTNVSGYIPPRPSALDTWTNESLRAVVGQVVQSASVKPTNDLLSSLGPIFRDATIEVLKGSNNPARAAEMAIERLTIP